MTNVTLSVEDETYKKMKQFSEIKWSEYIRKSINNRISELESLEKPLGQENILTMLASEHVLSKDWDNEADERWNDV